MEFRGRGHRVPPIATKCTHRRFQRALQRVAPSGTEASEQHQVSTFAVSGAQFSSATEHHRVPLCAALRAMPTNADLTLICAGALQEPSQPILRCAETATQANAGRRAPPDATECHKVHTSARHRAPPCGVTARRCLPPATAFHRVPLIATVRCKAPPSATIRATARRRVLPSAAECQMPPTDISTARAPTSGTMHTKRYCVPPQAARHRPPLRGTASATGGCRASLRAMESRTECHRVPPIATKGTHCAPPSATERRHCVPTRANAFHRVPPSATYNRVAPSGTEWHRGLRAT